MLLIVWNMQEGCHWQHKHIWRHFIESIKETIITVSLSQDLALHLTFSLVNNVIIYSKVHPVNWLYVYWLIERFTSMYFKCILFLNHMQLLGFIYVYMNACMAHKTQGKSYNLFMFTHTGKGFWSLCSLIITMLFYSSFNMVQNHGYTYTMLRKK